jgi:aryl-alcohol dehydrogenase-like predicted oxidoreductase
MERIRLGRSPISASRIVFGAMAVGSARHDEQRRIATIHAAVDAGMTTIDTAPLYDLGLGERTVGRAIAGLRDQVQVFTKVGLRWDDPHGQIMFTTRDEHGQPVAVRKNSRPESVRLEVERSLGRLGVDVLDLVYVHQRDADTPIAETMGALHDLLREGKLRAIGVSTGYTAEDLLEAQRALGDTPLASVQLHYSLIERGHEAELLSVAHEHRIGVLAHSTLELGLLTGKLMPSSTFGSDDMRQSRPNFHPDNIRRIAEALQRAVEPVAIRHGASVAQVVLAWVLAQPSISAIVVGASWPEQVRANAQAVTLRLSADEQFSIQRVFDHVVLDPSAGTSRSARVRGEYRRVATGARRRLTRAARSLPAIALRAAFRRPEGGRLARFARTIP